MLGLPRADERPQETVTEREGDADEGIEKGALGGISWLVG